MPLHLLIDMRCLQDPDNAERGIPAHAGTLLRHARATSPVLANAHITALIEPDLPSLPADLAGIADTLRPNAYLPDAPPGAVFLNLSPMAPNQQVLGRLLHTPRIGKAAIVYDFIPLNEPDRYLANPPTRLAYHVALAWLRRYQLYLPISAPTETRLRALFPTASTLVTGVPLSLFPHIAAPLPPAHILMVGGDDPRKNPELAIRAHAASVTLQSRRVPLLITGHYEPLRQAELRALAAQHGGADLLILPGRLPATALRDAYQAAFCVVTPSRAEGFSLPVIEAIAASVPSLASDIPAHTALLPNPAWRFGLHDAPALTARLERIVTEPAHRASVIAAQSPFWPAFRAEAVAAKLWGAVAALAPPPAPAVTRHRRPRFALLSPLPPAQSGVADFSAALARALAGHAEVSLFSSNPAAGAAPLAALPHLSRRFDRVISALGNSAHYGGIYDLLRRYGGACICHDARLLGFALTRFGPDRTAALAAEELRRPVTAADVIAWGADETSRPATLLGEAAAAAAPLIFHNRHSVAEVQARFGVTAQHLPFALYRPWPGEITAAARAAARQRLNLPPTTTIIASFGFIDPSKGIDPALRALALLRDAGHLCRLLWVGQAATDLTPFTTLAGHLGVAKLVHFNTAYLTEAAYRDHLLAADLGLQLRIGPPGNVSGALQDCIAAGLRTVANQDLADNLDAPSTVHRIPNALNPTEIRDALIALKQIPPDEPERAAWCNTHSMARYTQRLSEILGV